MRSAYRPIWLMLAAIFLLVSVSKVNTLLMQPKELIEWKTDFPAALNEAAVMRKPLLIYFSDESCEPCNRMEATTFADRNVEAAMAAYLPVKVNVTDQAELVKKFAVASVPKFVILESTGEIRGSLDGLQDSDRFIGWLKLSPQLGPNTYFNASLR